MKISKFKDIDNLHHSDFEIFVKDLFISAGWKDAYITQLGDGFRSGDGGVDIFAYRNQRKYAIEVKQRDIKTAVDVKALNQLHTGAKLGNASNSILVTNSYFTSEVKIRALRLGVELIDRDELQNLWLEKKSEIGREIKPHNFQKDIINECLSKYNKKRTKLLIEMATGLGKTYTVALFLKKLMVSQGGQPKVLFLAHQIEILLQTVTAFKNVFGIGRYSFSACFSGAAPENTDFVFGTFDTLYGQISNLKKEEFDFIVVDEAHHTPANTYRQVVEAFDPKLLVGLTATPFRADNKNVNKFFGGDDGHVGKYDLIWALANKKLAFPRYHVLLDDLDQDKIDQLESGLSIADLDKKLFLHKKDEEVVKVIEKTVKEKKLDPVKGIVFCRNISHINHLIGFFKLGTAISIHSHQTQDLRRENLRKFREDHYKFILVCDLFNEGVDIPETNLLVFMRYTGSQTVWLQQLGRGLRKTEAKKYVDVLDFVGSLDRLDQINKFSSAVKSTAQDPKERPEPDERPSSENIHDSTIDVLYSESAARVLDLIQDLKYRLNSRADLIAKLKNFVHQENYIPKLNQLEILLDNVSVDQVCTHFESYYGFLSETLGHTFNPFGIISQVEEFVRDFKAQNGVLPSSRAIVNGLSFESLALVSERDLHKLQIRSTGIGDETKHENDVDTKNSRIDEGRAKIEPSADMENDLGEQNLILEKYAGKVYGRKDYQSLPSKDKEEIATAFKSPSIFLNKLRKVREK
ncbi:DEAD/DEAH box helicase family protein [Halomonas sp. AOP13-D3-9]